MLIRGFLSHLGGPPPEVLQKPAYLQTKQLASESSYRVAQTSYGIDWIIFIIGTSIGAEVFIFVFRKIVPLHFH